MSDTNRYAPVDKAAGLFATIGGMAISQLQHVIDNSALSDNDKDLWLRAMELLDEEQAETILQAVQDDPHELEDLTRNLKVKQVAFATGDQALMDQVLEEEKTEISDL
jgi:hypothetical protein